MAHGVTPEGFTRPTVAEIKEEFEREQLASIDPTLDIATDPVVGQLNQIFAEHLGQGWDALEKAFEGNDPDKAMEFLLVSLGKLTGTQRLGATHTRVDLRCTFENAGVVLEAGVHFANVENRPDLRYTLVEDYTSGGAGNEDVVFRAEQTGPIVPIVNAINVIATPVTGWTGVLNPSVATPGRDIETAEELRERREADLNKPGSARVKAIAVDVLQVDGVQSVVPLENRTGLRDTATGLPPHAFEMVIWAGDPLDADTAEIAQAIWDSRAGAGESHGAYSGLVQTGDDPPVALERFGLATVREVWLRYDVRVGDDWIDAATFATRIATELNARHDIGNRVIAEKVRALAFEEDIELPDGTIIESLGVEDLVEFAIGFSDPATGEENLDIAIREIARFDAPRIVVNVIA